MYCVVLIRPTGGYDSIGPRGSWPLVEAPARGPGQDSTAAQEGQAAGRQRGGFGALVYKAQCRVLIRHRTGL